MKRATLAHPKTFALARILKTTRRDVLGLLTLLWDYTGQYAMDGRWISINIHEIARACDWPPEDAKTLIDALIETHWLDQKDDVLTIHDWEDHCEQWVKKRRNRDLQMDIHKPTKDIHNSSNGYPNLALPAPAPAPILNPPTPLAGGMLSIVFNAFWSAWPPHPRKTGKAQCLKFWKNSKLDPLAERIGTCLQLARASPDWKKENGQFIPAPIVWLRKTPWLTDPAELAGNNGQSKSNKLATLHRELDEANSACRIQAALRITSEINQLEAL